MKNNSQHIAYYCLIDAMGIENHAAFNVSMFTALLTIHNSYYHYY